ncbi:MAG: SPOR domain-containing protein [Flavobacteriaceae bacterium]
MELNRLIQELLFQYECVTVPNFGAFLTRARKIEVTDAGNFYPPFKEITFNQLLVANDGLLAQTLASKRGVSYESAVRLIEKEVSIWKKRLNTQVLHFPGVGDIRLNQDKKILFTPWGKINFDLDAYGLSYFECKPLESEQTEPKIISPMEDQNKDDLMFTPEQEEDDSQKSPILKYVAIGVIGVALLGASYFFGDRYVTEQRLIAQQQAQKQIEKNVQEATFELGNLSAIELAVTTNSIDKEVVPEQVFFSVIAGSFRSLENAEKKVRELILDGFPAEVAESPSEGFYRAAFGRYETKKEALNMLYFIKYTLEEDAWYLEEN